MSHHHFVGPDGKHYAENTPEDGCFLHYHDGRYWLIAFPHPTLPDSAYYFFGDRLPTSSDQWTLKLLRSNSPFALSGRVSQEPVLV